MMLHSPSLPDRPPLDEYFLKIATVVAERSTCRRHHVGAVSVRDKHILTTGYNGAPSGLLSCLDRGYCIRTKMEIPSGERIETCAATHAEENAIIQGSLHGLSLAGSTIYCTHSPCTRCAKMLINAEIDKFVTFGEYADQEFRELFKFANIEFVKAFRPSNTITEMA